MLCILIFDAVGVSKPVDYWTIGDLVLNIMKEICRFFMQ